MDVTRENNLKNGASLFKLLPLPKGSFFLFFSFAVPIGTVGYALISDINESIHVIDRELKGLSYIERLREPLRHLQQHRGMTAAFKAGDETFHAMMLETQSIIDQDFHALYELDGTFPSTRQFSIRNQITVLEQKWRVLKTSVNKLPSNTSILAHNIIIADLIGLFGYVIDASGLIQEPAIDGFYMVDLLGIQLPRLTELIGQVRAQAARVAASSAISDDAQLQLLLGLDRIAERNRRLEHDLNAVFIARSDLKSRLATAGSETSDNVAAFSALVRERLLSGEKISVSADAVFESGTRAVDSVFATYDQVLPSLGALLQSRLNEHRERRLITIGIATIIAFLILHLLSTRTNLEHLVEERTRELKNINHELEAFSYSVSHDLRAPLRAINGFSAILKDELRNQLSDEGKHCLGRILDSTIRMEALIDGLLLLSQVLRRELRVEHVNLSLMASEIAARLQESLPRRSVTFQISPGLTAVGDTKLLQAALENLFGNAWKFTERRPAAVIEFGRVADALGEKFYVRDNGAGFDVRFSLKLFAPFERLHDESEYVGNGIGLATVRRIVERHGGKIWGVGALGEGATFYFTLGTPE